MIRTVAYAAAIFFGIVRGLDLAGARMAGVR